MVIPKKDPLFLAAEHLTKTPPKDGYLFGHYGRTKYEAENLVREANGKRLPNGMHVPINYQETKLRDEFFSKIDSSHEKDREI